MFLWLMIIRLMVEMKVEWLEKENQWPGANWPRDGVCWQLIRLLAERTPVWSR